MANEITMTISATLTNPSTVPAAPQVQLKDSFSLSQKYTQTTALKWDEAVSLTAGADTSITFTGVTTAGWCLLVNLDPTNYVQWGPNNAGAILVMGRMKPGEAAWFRIDSGTTLRLKANTGNCIVQIKVWND